LKHPYNPSSAAQIDAVWRVADAGCPAAFTRDAIATWVVCDTSRYEEINDEGILQLVPGHSKSVALLDTAYADAAYADVDELGGADAGPSYACVNSHVHFLQCIQCTVTHISLNKACVLPCRSSFHRADFFSFLCFPPNCRRQPSTWRAPSLVCHGGRFIIRWSVICRFGAESGGGESLHNV
jgi:hypothetical protein